MQSLVVDGAQKFLVISRFAFCQENVLPSKFQLESFSNPAGYFLYYPLMLTLGTYRFHLPKSGPWGMWAWHRFVSSLHLSSQRQIRPIFSSFQIHMALRLRPLIISEPFSEVLPVWLRSPQNKLYLFSVNQFTSLSCWPARSPVPTSQMSSQTLLLLREPVVIHSPPDPSSWHTSFSLELSAAAIVWPLAVTC